MARSTNSLRRQKPRSIFRVIADEVQDGAHKRYGMSVLVAGTLVAWSAIIIT